MGTSTSAPPTDVTKYDSPPEKCVFFNKHGKIGLNNDNRIPPTSDPTERRERRLDLLKWHLKNDIVDAAEWITQNQHLVEKEILGPLCVLLVCLVYLSNISFPCCAPLIHVVMEYTLRQDLCFRTCALLSCLIAR